MQRPSSCQRWVASLLLVAMCLQSCGSLTMPAGPRPMLVLRDTQPPPTEVLPTGPLPDLDGVLSLANPLEAPWSAPHDPWELLPPVCTEQGHSVHVNYNEQGRLCARVQDNHFAEVMRYQQVPVVFSPGYGLKDLRKSNCVHLHTRKETGRAPIVRIGEKLRLRGGMPPPVTLPNIPKEERPPISITNRQIIHPTSLLNNTDTTIHRQESTRNTEEIMNKLKQESFRQGITPTIKTAVKNGKFNTFVVPPMYTKLPINQQQKDKLGPMNNLLSNQEVNIFSTNRLNQSNNFLAKLQGNHELGDTLLLTNKLKSNIPLLAPNRTEVESLQQQWHQYDQLAKSYWQSSEEKEKERNMSNTTVNKLVDQAMLFGNKRDEIGKLLAGLQQKRSSRKPISQSPQQTQPTDKKNDIKQKEEETEEQSPVIIPSHSNRLWNNQVLSNCVQQNLSFQQTRSRLSLGPTLTQEKPQQIKTPTQSNLLSQTKQKVLLQQVYDNQAQVLHQLERQQKHLAHTLKTVKELQLQVKQQSLKLKLLTQDKNLKEKSWQWRKNKKATHENNLKLLKQKDPQLQEKANYIQNNPQDKSYIQNNRLATGLYLLQGKGKVPESVYKALEEQDTGYIFASPVKTRLLDTVLEAIIYNDFSNLDEAAYKRLVNYKDPTKGKDYFSRQKQLRTLNSYAKKLPQEVTWLQKKLKLKVEDIKKVKAAMSNTGFFLNEVSGGYLNAWLSNSLGAPRREPLSNDYALGQKLGDVTSIVTGGLETMGGLGLLGTSVTTLALSGGGSVMVISPSLATSGYLFTTHGLFTVQNGFKHLFDENGRVYATGKGNEKRPKGNRSFKRIDEKDVGKTGNRLSKILGWGKNSTGHLIKHRDVLGYGHISAQEAQKILPRLRGAANQLFNHMKLSRIGRWEGYIDAKFYIGKGKMIVTQKDGTLITLINKTSNNWFQKAIPIN